MVIDNDGTIVDTARGACKACGAVHSVLTRPLVANVDTIHLFLTLGVVLVSILIWSRVLAYLKD